jgi:glycosyl transferase family 25
MTRQSAQIYVISVNDAHQRRENVRAQLSGASVRWEIIDAVRSDSTAVTDLLERYRNSKKWHKPLQAGEIACYLSHRKVWQKMLDDQVERALILEDDFQLKMPIDEIVMLLHEFRSDYDMVKLHGKPKHSRSIEECLHGRELYGLHQAFSVTGITVAQWVCAKAIPRLMVKAEQIERPIDMDIKHFWEYPLTVYHLIPEVVEEVSAKLGGTSIQNRKSSKTFRQWLQRWSAKCIYYGNCIKHYHR